MHTSKIIANILPLLVLSHIFKNTFYSQTISFTKQYNKELSRVYFKFMKHIKSNKNVYFTEEKLRGKLNIKKVAEKSEVANKKAKSSSTRIQ